MYDFQSLNQNTQYQISTTPYGYTGVVGNANVIDVSTLTILNTLTFTQTTPNNYMLAWGGNYAYVNVSWRKDGITTVQSNIVAPSLDVYLTNPNNNILFTVTSYNQNNVAGAQKSLTVRTENNVVISY
jgi:hypothetical protein